MRSVHPHDTYVTEDGKKIRIIGNNMLVKIDTPPKQTASGLVLYASGSMENVNNTGTVVAVGYEYTEDGDRIPLRGIEVGEKVLFIRFLADQHTNEQIREMFGKDLIRIQPSDVQLVFAPEDQKRVSW